MSFKDNILKKIKIDKIAGKVNASARIVNGIRKIDKETMRALLKEGVYEHQRKRDLDLYILETGKEKKKILVLDNELPIYKTTIDDVVLRKTPYVKEMINIKNIIKILNDSDVVVSKGADSIKTIQKECIDLLDLSYDRADICEIEKNGILCLEAGDTEGVIENIHILSELLGYGPPPKNLKYGNSKIFGASTRAESGETVFGPMVIYSIAVNRLMLVDDKTGVYDKGKIEELKQIVLGNKKASKEGNDVFKFLKEETVLRKL